TSLRHPHHRVDEDVRVSSALDERADLVVLLHDRVLVAWPSSQVANDDVRHLLGLDTKLLELLFVVLRLETQALHLVSQLLELCLLRVVHGVNPLTSMPIASKN